MQQVTTCGHLWFSLPLCTPLRCALLNMHSHTLLDTQLNALSPFTLYIFLQAAFVDIRTNGIVTAILPQLVQFTLNAVSDSVGPCS